MPWVHRTDATVCHMEDCIRDDHKAVDEETIVLIESAKHLNTPPQYAEVIREPAPLTVHRHNHPRDDECTFRCSTSLSFWHGEDAHQFLENGVYTPAQLWHKPKFPMSVGITPQPQWVHKDGSLCPNWEECDTYEHTSLDGNETIQRIQGVGSVTWKRDDLDPEPEPDEICVACPHKWTDHAASSSDDGCKLCACTRYHDQLGQRDGNVGELIDGRVNVYGDPIMGFTRHAQVWTGILGIEVQPWQVALCMLGYKLVRTGITPDYSDNSDDIEGYLDIFRQLMPDMVQARDTAEYLAGGGQGARA